MRIFITGGSGDLGILLARDLDKRGDVPVRMDIREPRNPQRGEFIQGSILDRPALGEAMAGADCVVHIAAWHGIHLISGRKNVYDFWDLNVTGTFNVFQAAADHNISKFVYISSTSIQDRFGVYGHSKVLGEEIAETYHQRHGMQVITLRPSAFIPYWNRDAYQSFAEFARWYWKGAVHINDVLQAVTRSIDYLAMHTLDTHPRLYVDGKYEYTAKDLANWDENNPTAAFMKYYSAYLETAEKYDLDPAQKPEVFDIKPTQELLGYQPTYSPLNLLQDLREYGESGPPIPEF